MAKMRTKNYFWCIQSERERASVEVYVFSEVLFHLIVFQLGYILVVVLIVVVPFICFKYRIVSVVVVGVVVAIIVEFYCCIN